MWWVAFFLLLSKGSVFDFWCLDYKVSHHLCISVNPSCVLLDFLHTIWKKIKCKKICKKIKISYIPFTYDVSIFFPRIEKFLVIISLNMVSVPFSLLPFWVSHNAYIDPSDHVPHAPWVFMTHFLLFFSLFFWLHNLKWPIFNFTNSFFSSINLLSISSNEHFSSRIVILQLQYFFLVLFIISMSLLIFLFCSCIVFLSS